MGALLLGVLSPAFQAARLSAAAPAAKPASAEYLVEVWDTDRGMPSSAVTSIASTADGYLWVGTFEGLARFDGNRFTVINHRNTPDFPDDAVTSLHVDRSGQVWAGTGNGIVRREGGRWRSYPGPSGQPLHFARQISEDETGAILAVSGNRFHRLSGDRFVEMAEPTRILYLRLFAVPGQGLWASAGNYVGRLHGPKWEEIELPQDLKDSCGAAPSRDQAVWVAGPAGIRRYQNGTWSPLRPAPPGFRFTPPVSLLEDSLGNVWAGDYRAGLIQFRKDGTVLQFTRQQGLPNPTVRALFEDKEQSVWAATDGGGLVRFRRRSVTMFDESQGLNHSVVNSVFEESPGSLLIGTYGGGLQRFDQATLRFSAPLAPPAANLTASSMVLSLVRDSEGTVWAGTFGRGLFRIRGSKVEQIAETAEGAWQILALFVDSRRTLWIGYPRGVASYSDGRLTIYTNVAGAPQKEIVSLAEDGSGDLWAGGTEGLFHLHGGRFEKYVPPGLPDYAPITSLYADREGWLWIGTRDRGLDRLRAGKFTAYGLEQGLAASRVSSILDDDEGRLWLATQLQGLVGVTRASLDAVAAGRQPQLDLIWLRRETGLATNQLRTGFQPAAAKGADGRLWFATLQGLAMVDPRQAGQSTLQVPVRIEEVTIGNRHVPMEQIAGDTLYVPPGTRRLQISFTKPNFRGPEHIRFQYGLEGLHPGWVDAEGRSASFGDLKPARYVFRVRATDSNGIWNAGTASLNIVIEPFYWETVWFRLAAVLALTAITGGAGYGIQSRTVKRQAKQLEKEQTLRRDIERMQGVLRISEERFSKAFEASPVPMAIVALEDGRYLHVNQRFLESTGRRPEELVGRCRTEVNLWEDPQEAARFTELAKSNRRVRKFEARVKTPSGRLVYHLLSTEVIELDGQPCLLVAADDITERKGLEEQLYQAQKLESVGRLAGGVAHDFNNLLTVINGYSDLVLQRLQQADPNWARVDQIRKAGDRAAELTRQLLAFSRKQVIKPQTLDVNSLIGETEPMLRRLLPETIDVSLHLHPEPLYMLADSGQLNQVLINLAVNARDAMPEGGTLMVETDSVELDEEFAAHHPGLVPGPYVRLAISDSGVGMSADVRKHVFEPFFTTKRKGAGTGLGLATVYGIVRQNGGWIWVYSEPEHGTVFKIYFPRVAGGPLRHETELPRAGSYGGRETVLVVEDQEDVRNLAREVLESFGYLVLVAAHGADALVLAENYRGPIHLMLTDVVMPGMTGKELAARMKLQRPATKVLFMSGYTENVIATQGVIESDIAFIPKPLSPEALAAKVRETLGPQEPA